MFTIYEKCVYNRKRVQPHTYSVLLNLIINYSQLSIFICEFLRGVVFIVSREFCYFNDNFTKLFHCDSHEFIERFCDLDLFNLLIRYNVLIDY